MSRGVTFAAAALGSFLLLACASSPEAGAPTSPTTSNGGAVSVSGAIDCLTGTVSAFSFFVSAREVRGNLQTQFAGGSNFALLQNGRSVEAQGALTGSVLTADASSGRRSRGRGRSTVRRRVSGAEDHARGRWRRRQGS
jgi:hypothetical protein